MGRFLVIAIDDSGEEWTKIMTADEIFNLMDMADCYGLSIDIWKINGFGEALTECSFLGCWHDGSDPLKMCIIGDGVKEVGYGTDH